MKKKFGKTKAGGITNNGLIMIVSIIAVTLFIGTAVQPAIAVSKSSNDPGITGVDEVCIPCNDPEKVTKGDPKCDTCVAAVFHAIKYMMNHTITTWKNNKSGDWHFFWTVDASLLITQGLILGIEDSGFRIEIDYEDLFHFVDNMVDKLVDPANYLFPVTIFLARLAAIPIGITVYLLKLCW